MASRLNGGRKYIDLEHQNEMPSWDEVTYDARRAETSFRSHGTYVGLVCAGVAAIIMVLLFVMPGFALMGTGASELQATSADSNELAAPGAGEAELAAASAESSSDTTGGATTTISTDPRTAQIVAGLTTQEKVAQLFLTTPEELVGGSRNTVNAAGDVTQEAIEEHAVGGIVYDDDNVQNEDQIKQMLKNTQRYSNASVGLPMFLAVAEEGGSDSLFGDSDDFPEAPTLPSASELAGGADTGACETDYQEMGEYLLGLGFNVELGPVADLSGGSDSSSSMVGQAFGSDAQTVAEMVAAASRGLDGTGICFAPKYFPGTTGTNTNAHTTAEMRQTDLLPFETSIDAGAQLVMVGNITTPNIVGSNGNSESATLNSAVVSDLLRNEVGFAGVIVTDDIAESSLAASDGTGEAAVVAIEAGADLVYVTDDWSEAYDAVMAAVESGEISADRLDESVSRVVNAKLNMNTGLFGKYETAAGSVGGATSSNGSNSTSSASSTARRSGATGSNDDE